MWVLLTTVYTTKQILKYNNTVKKNLALIDLKKNWKYYLGFCSSCTVFLCPEAKNILVVDVLAQKVA